MIKGMFISHGASDQVLAVPYAKEALSYLHTRQLQPEYHEYQAGHSITQPMLDDLVAWLSS